MPEGVNNNSGGIVHPQNSYQEVSAKFTKGTLGANDGLPPKVAGGNVVKGEDDVLSPGGSPLTSVDGSDNPPPLVPVTDKLIDEGAITWGSLSPLISVPVPPKFSPPPPLNSPPPGNISMGAAIFLSCLPSLVVFVQLFNFIRTQHEIKEENREIILNEIKQAFVEMEAESAAIGRSFDARKQQMMKQVITEYIAAGQSLAQAGIGAGMMFYANRQRQARLKEGEAATAKERAEVESAQNKLEQNKAGFARRDDSSIEAKNAQQEVDSKQTDFNIKEKALNEAKVKQQEAEVKYAAYAQEEQKNSFVDKIKQERKTNPKDILDLRKTETAKAQHEFDSAQKELNSAQAKRDGLIISNLDETQQKALKSDQDKLAQAKATLNEKMVPHEAAADQIHVRAMRYGDIYNQLAMTLGSTLKGTFELLNIQNVEEEKLAEQSRLLHQTMRSCCERLLQSLTENTKEANDLLSQAMEKLAQVMSLISWKN